MPNTTDREVKIKHRKRKNRIRRNKQNSILEHAKKKTILELESMGELPKIARGRL